MSNEKGDGRPRALMLASVASMIDQFNMPNIRLLQQLGYKVHVMCNFERGNTCDRARIRVFQKELDAQGIDWHQWDCPRRLRAVSQCVEAYAQLWKRTSACRYALIHCHSPIGGALARVVAHQRGIPVIYTAHGFHFYKGAPLKNWLFYYPAEKLLAYWTDVLITVNKEDYAFAKRNLAAGKVYRIPGVGVDTAKFACAECVDLKAWYRLPGHAVLLLSVGELNKRKNHRIVLEALADMGREDVFYVICGQGTLRKHLMQEAERLRLQNHVIFHGFRTDMAAVYQSADLFVFPSVHEGMPVALMEAMAAGLPCVVSDIRGNRELIDEQGGGRFRLGDRRQLGAVLSMLLSDQALRDRCGKRNRDYIRKFDLAFVEPKMARIYSGSIGAQE